MQINFFKQRVFHSKDESHLTAEGHNKKLIIKVYNCYINVPIIASEHPGRLLSSVSF